MENPKDTQDWIEAYKELCAIIKNEVTDVQHTDLYYDQLAYEKEEYPFPEKCLFFDFSAPSIDAIGIKTQDMNMLVSVVFAFDTFSDSFDGSDNQAIALEFGSIMRKIHAALQARSGKNFSALNRVSMLREPAPEGCIAYRQVYSCIIRDYSPILESVTTDLEARSVTVEIQNAAPPAQPDIDLYKVNM